MFPYANPDDYARRLASLAEEDGMEREYTEHELELIAEAAKLPDPPPRRTLRVVTPLGELTRRTRQPYHFAAVGQGERTRRLFARWSRTEANAQKMLGNFLYPVGVFPVRDT